MKVLLNESNVVFDFGEDIVFAKGGAPDGGLMPCEEAEATHIWNREKNMACMAGMEIRMIEVAEIPVEVKEHEYKYVDGEFVINEEYVPYVSPEERIAMLEDVMNEILFGEV